MAHVLIVDDQEESRDLLNTLLQGNGFRVTLTHDGLEALEAARREPPDVVVSDALMPKMDGFALCRAWMQDGALSAIPFVFYSASSLAPEDARLALSLGALRYLTKPLEAEVFLGELRAALAQRAAHPTPAAALEDSAVHALHDAVLARKLEAKIGQLEASNRELRESEARLRDSEQRYRSIVETSLDGFWIVDTEGRVLDVNDAYCRLSGYAREELLRMRINDLDATEDPAATAARIRDLIKKGGGQFEVRHRHKNGQLVDLGVSATFRADLYGGCFFLFLRDITQRKRAEEALRESEARFRSLTEMSSDFYWETDAEHRITLRTAGNTANSLSVNLRTSQIGKRRWEIPYVSPDEAGWQAHRAVLDAHRPFRNFELSRLNVDGNERFALLSGDPVFDAAGAFKGYRGVGIDVTERKQFEAGLKLFRALIDQSNDAIEVIDPETLRLLDVNQKGCLELGYSREELLALTVFDIDPVFDRSAAKDFVRKLRKSGSSIIESRHRRKDGTEFPVEVSISHIQLDREYLLSIARDITDRQQREQDLLRFRLAMDATEEAIYLVDRASMRFIDINAAACAMRDQTREEILALGPEEVLTTSRAELERTYDEVIAGGAATQPVEMPRRRKDGTQAWVELRRHAQQFDDGWMIVTVVRDVTARKRMETELRAAEEQFRGLVEQSIAGIFIIQDGKFAYVNPRFAQIYGYESSEELIGRESLSLVAEDDRAQVAENRRLLIEGEEASRAYNFTAPRKDGSAIQVGAHAACATHDGRPAIIGLLQDISEKKRAEEEIQRYLKQLEAALLSTVELATTLSELRDPYRAGHERRVAQIAVALGAELGFDPQRIEGLRVAGYLHDIGTIGVPAEILSKPGKLSPIEFQLIQGHAQASYDALKTVQFPWPVAEIALQHHERMDGSGYPQGLKGEAILIEARILAVADVVEAISSHRPYRAGLGIDKALAEIERGRGSVYDPLVADACLRLFREKAYRLPD